MMHQYLLVGVASALALRYPREQALEFSQAHAVLMALSRAVITNSLPEFRARVRGLHTQQAADAPFESLQLTSGLRNELREVTSDLLLSHVEGAKEFADILGALAFALRKETMPRTDGTETVLEELVRLSKMRTAIDQAVANTPRQYAA